MLDQCRLPGSPVKTFQLIGKNNTCNAATFRSNDLKGISLDAGRDWTEKRQPDFSIVRLWRYNQSLTPASLFTARLWCELQPDQITSVRNIGGSH